MSRLVSTHHASRGGRGDYFLVGDDFRLVKINVSMIREPANDGIVHVFFLAR